MLLTSVVRSNIGKPLVLTVYSSKFLKSRGDGNDFNNEIEVEIVPKESPYGYLGCTVRLCSFHGAETVVWKVLNM
jgi:hypothetical protein